MKNHSEMFMRAARLLAVFAVLCPLMLIVANYFTPLSPALDNTGAYFRRPVFIWSFPFMTPYMLCMPDDYDPHSKYPLVLVLHGARKVALEADTLAAPNIQQKYPAFIVMPLAPFHETWALPAGPEFRQSGHNALPLAMQVLEKVEAGYSIDRDRVYITGVSSGGFGVYGALIHYPQTFAGAVEVSGGWAAQDADKVSPVPMWVFHGADDREIPVRYARDMVKAVNDHGGHVKYTEFAGMGHASWGAAFGNDKLWYWLFAQNRMKN